MLLIQDGYKRITTHDLDPRASKGDAYCMAAVNVDASCAPPKEAYVRDQDGQILRDEKGRPMVDVLKTDPPQHVLCRSQLARADHSNDAPWLW